jgi:hypothetical protein
MAVAHAERAPLAADERTRLVRRARLLTWGSLAWMRAARVIAIVGVASALVTRARYPWPSSGSQPSR